MLWWERRAHDRLSLTRPCKLYLPVSGRYVAGSTGNLSPGGALIHLDRPAPLGPGDRLFVGIAVKRRQALLAANEMLEAEVVRSVLTMEEQTIMAVRFRRSQEGRSQESGFRIQEGRIQESGFGIQGSPDP